ncbi:MAG: hypothetical protein IKN50_03555 [Clostridia bacterium]|nr:hypothetical protein [Clostridia bacterium]
MFFLLSGRFVKIKRNKSNKSIIAEVIEAGVLEIFEKPLFFFPHKGSFSNGKSFLSEKSFPFFFGKFLKNGDEDDDLKKFYRDKRFSKKIRLVFTVIPSIKQRCFQSFVLGDRQGFEKYF